MKAPNIRYMRARSVVEASRVIADHDGDAIPLAGGQSLLPALNLRLAAPQLLVDIDNLEELRGTHLGADEIRLGALTRHAELLESPGLNRSQPMLPRAAMHIGHAAIRNRGTLGGSLAFADPAAELPACAVALDAIIVVVGPAGERELRAEAFFTGLMETALRPGELIVAVRIPVARSGSRYAFAELARRHGDFAVAGLAIAAEVEQGQICTARAVYFGCTNCARVAANVSAALVGSELKAPACDALLEAVAADLSPDDTPGWRAETKLKLAKVLTKRARHQLAGASAW